METDITVVIGQRLRQARERQGLDIQDVANRLFLTKQRIIDIENGDYSKIASPTYVRGYVRAYAKLVKLEIEEFLRVITVEEPKPEVKPEPVPVKSRHNYWLDVLVVLALLLVVLLWWFNHG